jgi:hypothetical protein
MVRIISMCDCEGTATELLMCFQGHSTFAWGSRLGGACLAKRRERKELRNKTMFLTPPSLSCSMILKAKLLLNLCDCGTTVTKSTK